MPMPTSSDFNPSARPAHQGDGSQYTGILEQFRITFRTVFHLSKNIFYPAAVEFEVHSPTNWSIQSRLRQQMWCLVAGKQLLHSSNSNVHEKEHFPQTTGFFHAFHTYVYQHSLPIPQTVYLSSNFSYCSHKSLEGKKVSQGV